MPDVSCILFQVAASNTTENRGRQPGLGRHEIDNGANSGNKTKKIVVRLLSMAHLPHDILSGSGVHSSLLEARGMRAASSRYSTQLIQYGFSGIKSRDLVLERSA